MSNKTWTLKVNELELRTLIKMHAETLSIDNNMEVETSARIHDLTKRLNKDTPEIETETKNETEAKNEPAPAPAPMNAGW